MVTDAFRASSSLTAMDADAPALKRARTDAGHEAVLPIRSTEFWFDDGSVVLHVESTQFRVHRSILSSYSEVFRDMFAIPQPTVSGEVVEGCQIVQLTDKALDWENVLRALYDRRYDMLMITRITLL